MSASALLAALRRRLWLLNRGRLRRRELRKGLGYGEWCQRYDTLDETQAAALQQRARRAAATQTITVWLQQPAGRAPEPAAVQASLQSLQAQWLAPTRVLHVEPGHEATLAPAEGWVLPMRCGDRLRPHALLLLAEAAATRPEAQLVYADHDHLNAEGHRVEPHFKCDWNPDLLLSHDYLGAPALWRAARWQQALAAGPGEHGRALAAARGLSGEQVQHLPHVLLHRPLHSPALQADAAAVARELAQRGVAGSAEETPFGVRLHLALPSPPPLVSIVIPTRNGLALLRQCIGSLQRLTQYPQYEVVVVDNGSDDPACLRYLQQITHDPRIRVRRDDSPFNYAALNNDAVAECRGEVLVLLNNDIEVVDGDWLRQMVSLALQPGVGAVGARLLYGNRTVQHAGVILGILGGAGHWQRGLPQAEGGYLGRARQLMALSAVTAACLAVRRDHYLAVSGLDAAQFAVAFNDVDFCLRLRQHGLRNLYTPHALLLHHESATRGSDRDASRRERFRREHTAFRERWGALLENDPAFNPNLSLGTEHFRLADPPRRPPMQAEAG